MSPRADPEVTAKRDIPALDENRTVIAQPVARHSFGRYIEDYSSKRVYRDVLGSTFGPEAAYPDFVLRGCSLAAKFIETGHNNIFPNHYILMEVLQYGFTPQNLYTRNSFVKYSATRYIRFTCLVLDVNLSLFS
jgi:hypothetical protein